MVCSSHDEDLSQSLAAPLPTLPCSYQLLSSNVALHARRKVKKVEQCKSGDSSGERGRNRATAADCVLILYLI